jgi:hypothetical protein
VEGAEWEASQAKLTIDDLNQKISFLTGELGNVQQDLSKEQKLNSEKDIMIEQLKNSKEGDKILAHYEVESLKQKI